MASKALLVGVNRYKKFSSLQGCLQDVSDIDRLVKEQFGFDSDCVQTLIDEQATGVQVRKHWKWLYSKAQPGDQILFYFAGHGSYLADPEENEPDGRVTLLCLHDMDFKTPESYITIHSLVNWMKVRPKGTNVTAILDSSQGNEGTHLISSSRKTSIRIDLAATLMRAESEKRDKNRLDAHDERDPLEEYGVRARFIDPPEAVKQKALKLAARHLGGESQPQPLFRRKGLNLLFACQPNQAAIETKFPHNVQGAFTYHLCRTLRQSGLHGPPAALFDRLSKKLTADHFRQLPVLHSMNADFSLLQTLTGSSNEEERNSFIITQNTTPLPDPSERPTDAEAVAAVLHWVSSLENPLPTSTKNRVVDLMQAALTRLTVKKSIASEFTDRHLVIVPGSTDASRGVSDHFWNLLDELTQAYGSGHLGVTRHEVLWSSPVQIHKHHDEDVFLARQLIRARILGALEDRASKLVMKFAPRISGLELRNGFLLSENESLRQLEPHLLWNSNTGSRELLKRLETTLDQFLPFFFEKSVRAQFFGKFRAIVERLLQEGGEIDLIAEGWGSVVAYECLLTMESLNMRGKIRTFLTIGSPLSLVPVRELMDEGAQSVRRPALIKRWGNIDLQSDLLGGQILNHPFQVDFEFLELPDFLGAPNSKSSVHIPYPAPCIERISPELLARVLNWESQSESLE